MKTRTLILGLICLFLSSCQQPKQMADLIYINANIWTADSTQAHATAFAVVGEKIIAVGSDEQILAHKDGNTKVINAGGKMIVPGFIDSHLHLIAGGLNLLSIKLRDVTSPTDFAQRITAYAATLPKGTWVQGGEWDQSLWGGALPDRSWIDAGTPEHPVFVYRVDLHMGLANTLALKLAGIDKSTPDPEGGQIVRDAQGNPTGLLKDKAVNLLDKHIPAPSPERFEQAIYAAMQYLAAQGVTSVHNMAGFDFEGAMQALEKVKAEGKLTTRVYDYAPLDEVPQLAARIAKHGRGDHWLKIGGVKGFVDGSLGSHTAAFHEPYGEHQHDKGIYITPKDSLAEWISMADQAGLQIAVHAIGDEAITFILNTFEQDALQSGTKDRRFRIEHAQHIAPSDIARFANLKVIPSMQPYHLIDDGRWAEKVIGPERAKTSYAYKSLYDAGATVAMGSDWFVAPATPLEGIYAAVTRRTLDDKHPNGWVPEQKISVEQALAGYTRNGAFTGFDEDVKGRIAPNLLADFVVLSEDLFKVAPERIREVQVLETWVGGKQVYRK
jgi:predicted amidohydrolase YtcJ